MTERYHVMNKYRYMNTKYIWSVLECSQPLNGCRLTECRAKHGQCCVFRAPQKLCLKLFASELTSQCLVWKTKSWMSKMYITTLRCHPLWIKETNNIDINVTISLQHYLASWQETVRFSMWTIPQSFKRPCLTFFLNYQHVSSVSEKNTYVSHTILVFSRSEPMKEAKKTKLLKMKPTFQQQNNLQWQYSYT